MRLSTLSAVVAVLALAASPRALAAERVGYPNSIAATGDSIARAFNPEDDPLYRRPLEVLVDRDGYQAVEPLLADPDGEPGRQWRIGRST